MNGVLRKESISLRKNIYLIAGGPGSDSDSFIKKGFLESGRSDPSVAYIGTASGDSRQFLSRYFSPMLKRAGARKVTMVPLAGQPYGSDKARKILLESDIIFVSGGEVEDGIRNIPADVRVLLRQLYEMGKVFISVSAGTIMLGIAWPHWDDEDNAPDDARLFDCLGFVSAIFDTHCEGEDWVELRKAVSLSPEGFTGFGIPSGGCVLAAPDGSLHPTVPLAAFRCEKGQAVFRGEYLG